MKSPIKYCLLSCLLILNLSANAFFKIAVVYDKNIPQLQFAVEELKKICKRTGNQF